MKLVLHLTLIFLLLGFFLPRTATANKSSEKRRLQEKQLQAKYAEAGYAQTRADIVRKRRRHKQNLRNMVHSLRRKLSDHAYGSITLSPEEKAQAEYNVDILQRKVDSMADDVQDFEVDRILEREKSDHEKRMARSSRGRHGDSESENNA